MSRDHEFEILTTDYLEHTLGAGDRKHLEDSISEDAVSSRLADQLQMHHHLLHLSRPDGGGDLAGRVVRELKLEGDADRFTRDVVGRLKSGRRMAWGAVAAGIAIFFVIVFVILGGEGTERGGAAAGSKGQVLFIVDASPSGAADARVAARLSDLGFEVVVRRLLEVAPGDLENKSLIAVSSSSTVRRVPDDRSEVVDLLRDAQVGILTWEPMLFARLGMTRGEVHKTDWAAERDQTRIAIGSAHPLAAGLAGDVEVLERPLQVSWGRPAGEVTVAATLSGDASRAVLFGYETGAAMGRGRAPARRVGFFLFNESPSSLTEEGWILFEAAVRWSAEGRAE